ncbi:MAG: hypothetical protein HYT27_01455 [Parcubacteria group bacterium]|nr:hypothetical protein [Parcubacteria group bacterium]
MVKIFTGKMLRKQEAEEEKRFKRTYLPAAQLLIKFARKVMAEHDGLEKGIELRIISHGILHNRHNDGRSEEMISALKVVPFSEMPACYLELEEYRSWEVNPPAVVIEPCNEEELARRLQEFDVTPDKIKRLLQELEKL